jgi:hypothetical protein
MNGCIASGKFADAKNTPELNQRQPLSSCDRISSKEKGREGEKRGLAVAGQRRLGLTPATASQNYPGRILRFLRPSFSPLMRLRLSFE